MEQQKQIEYWKKASEMDLQSAIDIYESGKNFHFSLFLCHLSIEKILKALVVKFTNDFPPKSHNLLRLVELCRIDCDDETLTLLEELSQFQLSTRYPDELFSVHKLATKEFTTTKLEKVKELAKWLTSKL